MTDTAPSAASAAPAPSAAPPAHDTAGTTAETVAETAETTAETAETTAETVLLCIVTDSKRDVSLMCSMSLLRLQTELVRLPRRVTIKVHFVTSLDEALNALRGDQQASGAIVVQGTIGFETEFALRAIASGLPVVVGTYPLPRVDWDRVKTRPANEPPQHWGNVYNAKPTGTMRPGGYVLAADAELGVAWVARSVLTDIVARHPEVVSAEGRAAFATPGVFGGRYLTDHQRFLQLHGGDVWADTQHPACNSGPTEFVGCVGARAVLR